MKYQNNLSIQTILGLVALHISVFSAYLSYSTHNTDPCFFTRTTFIILGILSISTMILSIGMFLKKKWSRISFSILLHLFIISGVIAYLTSRISDNDFSEALGDLTFLTMFVFIPFIILIIVLHNKHIVEEFNSSHAICVPPKVKYSLLSFLLIMLAWFCWHVTAKHFLTGDIYCSMATDAVEYYKKADYAKARKYYEMAVSRGNLKAMYLLGEIYLDGKGINKDPVKAEKMFLESAGKGYGKSQYALGLLYFEGKDVKADFVKAKNWFEMASKQGNANAQYKLGTMYWEGIGVDKDLKKAKELFEKAKPLCSDAKIDLLILEKQEALPSLDQDKDKEEIEINLLLQKAFSGIKAKEYKSALNAYLGILSLLREDDPRYQKVWKKIVQLYTMIMQNKKIDTPANKTASETVVVGIPETPNKEKTEGGQNSPK